MQDPTLPIRQITDLLPVLDRGKFVDRVNQELAEAIATLENHPKGEGKATLTITLALAYQGGMVSIRPAIKAKLPEAASFTDTPFWTLEGALTVQHPSQQDMFAGPRAADSRTKDFA